MFFATLSRINEETLVKDTLEKASTLVDKPKTKKKKIWSMIFLTLNISLVFLVFYNFAVEQGGVHPLSELLAGHPKWIFLIIAGGLHLITVFFNAIKYFILIKHHTGKFRFWFSLKMATIGRYYDLITPMATGGQPFEIYYMRKNGYEGDKATSMPLAKYMVWQISFFFLCLIILILYSAEYISSPIVLICAWIGLSIVLLIFLFVFFVSVTNRFGASVVVAVLKLLFKLKIIKNYRKTLLHVLKFVKSYQYNIKSLVNNPLVVLGEIIVTILGIISNSLIAYFIYLTFADVPTVDWWQIVCMACICELASSFIPLPGGSGAQELSFNALFGALFPEGTFFWGVLFWRILTYYVYIAEGGILLIGSFIKHKFKSKERIPEDDAIKQSKN
jgi:uncharacterized protein (TIRG00374 family)